MPRPIPPPQPVTFRPRPGSSGGGGTDTKTFGPAAGRTVALPMPNVAREHRNAQRDAAKRQAQIDATLRGDPDNPS
jgi:hypothetical protein